MACRKLCSTKSYYTDRKGASAHKGLYQNCGRIVHLVAPWWALQLAKAQFPLNWN